MKPTKHYVIRVSCEVCPEGHHDRYAAANWTPWSSEKGARRHIADLLEHGYNVDGWKVVEVPTSSA